MAQQTLKGTVSDDAIKLLGLLVDEENCRILDIGAGNGIIARWLSDQGHDVLAIDIHEIPSAIKTSPSKGLRYIKGNFLTNQINQKFDRVLLMGVLHYCQSSDDLEGLLKKATSLLKTNGKLGAAWILKTEPKRANVYEPTVEQVKNILKGEMCSEIKGWTKHVHHDDHHGIHEHKMYYTVFEHQS